MNIFILEDDLFQQQNLRRTIEKISQEEKISYKNLIVTAKPDVLLENLTLASLHNLYFLDLEIAEYDKTGLEVAQRIRKQDPFGTIVFITTHSEMAPLTFAYKVSALDFIEKDQEEETIIKRIRECLLLANMRIEKSISDDALIFKNKFTNLQVPYSDIYYFETTGIAHKLRLVSKNKITEFYGELSEFENIDTRLFRCHRAFVVNLANIVSIDRTNRLIMFPNKDECNVSRRTMKELLNKMNQ
ncbi:response regulator transcription factor [Enterococcus hulanensis]|uniref:response regulator transcription factor n=1 Tax=Enterococcus hulanensis TaxID=2559929 RepID=UPI001A9060E3|nr:response regulator transcription factor [Enterococcus hulanensis]MBO0457895.1 response regulator transcription factor [Enterococcus hulanensis]